MVLAKQLLAILLAALVANPVCCCTLAKVANSAPDTCSSQRAKTCCAKKTLSPEGHAPDAPGEVPTCPCGKDQSAVAEAKTWKCSGVCLLDVTPEPAWTEFTLPALAAFSPPARRLDLPPPRPAWRRYCRYLL